MTTTTTDLRDTMPDGTNVQVITYQDSRGELIDLTPSEVAAWERAGRWPANSIGENYHSVHKGLHWARIGSARAPMHRRPGMPPRDA